MKIIPPLLIVSAIATSCGLILSQPYTPAADPEFHKKRLEELNAKKETKEQDSLIRLIESAPTQLQPNLTTTTLVVETYNYQDYLTLSANKFYQPQDSKRTRKYFTKYEREKTEPLKNYRHKTLYANKTVFDTLDLNEFRYVLKMATRLICEDDEVVIYNDGSAAGWVSEGFFYIYDRKTKMVFAAIKDIKMLTKL